MARITNSKIQRTYTDLIKSTRKEFLRFNKQQSRRLHGILTDLRRNIMGELAMVGDNVIQEAQLRGLLSSLGRYTAQFESEYSYFLKDSMRKSAKLVTDREDKIAALYTVGVDKSKMNLNLAFSNISEVPMETLFAMFLKDGKKLTDRIWNLADYTNRQVEDVVTQAVARGESAVKLSRKLERFLQPGKWGPAWTTRITPAKVYDLGGIAYTRGSVSYNALRLARTSINNAHREAHVQRVSFYKEAGLPIARGIKWNLGASHRIVDICDDWARGGLKGDGVYTLNDVPVDHPNGACYTTTALVPVEEFQKWADDLEVGQHTAKTEG